MRLNLTEKDWLKLRDFNNIFAREIQQSLPSDYELTLEEISSAIYDTYISLSKSYKTGAMSFTSYCYRYAKQYTLRDLLSEYNRLKQHDSELDISEIRHTNPNSFDNKMLCKELISKMTKEDQLIAYKIKDGYTYEEIAKEFNISKMAVSKRMRKYGKNEI